MAQVSNEWSVATGDSDWADLKAIEIIPGGIAGAEAYRHEVATALREADERARAEERAHAAKALKLAHTMQEKAIAAVRENSSRERIAAAPAE